MSKTTMKRLRDYPWNVRLGVIFAAIALVAASVIVSAEAQAATHPRAHLSAVRAHHAVWGYIAQDKPLSASVGPCRWHSGAVLRCAVSEQFQPTEADEGLARIDEWVTVSVAHGKLVVEGSMR